MKKILLGIILIIAISVIIFYYLGQRDDAAVLQVQVKIKGDISTTTIENITAYSELINKIRVPKGNLLTAPSLTVLVLQNKEIIGDWTPVPYKGEGFYNITVGLTKPLNEGETVRVIVRVMDPNYKVVAVGLKEITIYYN
ncbi:MAG: hypothetical protein PHU34_02670 [Candidatus Methanoperedens sp.]|nr:hypothetical protein [Candidatus Methanoperedens sp.]